MPDVPFTKMEGAGNDFIVIDGRKAPLRPEDFGPFAAHYCRRRRGVGSDGLLILLESPSGELDFDMRFFNPDGSEAEMCGNGARCISLFAFRKGAAGRSMRFGTVAGPVEAEITDAGVKLRMPPAPPVETLRLDIGDGAETELFFTNTGVPHAVIVSENLEKTDVKKLGAAVRYHEAFSPAGTNANFITKTGEDSISLRTYERGVEDETLACGTGACASAIAAVEKLGVRPPVKVLTRGGDTLIIHLRKAGDGSFPEVFLEGPAKEVFRGEAPWPPAG